MMYTSEEEEKRRVRRGKGKERQEGKAWAYGKGWPWTTSSIARAYHVLTMYDLQAATKRREGCEGEEEREGRRGRHGRMVRGGPGNSKVSLRPTMRMPYPSMPCGRPPVKWPS
jgi:hypothetical protein